jgi:hypothetical protein
MTFYLMYLYFCAATALYPRTHYAYGTSAGVMTDLQQSFEFMTDINMCVAALQEGEHYRRKEGSFSTELAGKMACDKNTSASKQ